MTKVNERQVWKEENAHRTRKVVGGGGAVWPCIFTAPGLVRLKQCPALFSDVPHRSMSILRGADKSLASPICSTTKIIFFGWVKEVRTTKS
jgi:hypothetical protein